MVAFSSFLRLFEVDLVDIGTASDVPGWNVQTYGNKIERIAVPG
jgi:hypothetical protein